MRYNDTTQTYNQIKLIANLIHFTNKNKIENDAHAQ